MIFEITIYYISNHSQHSSNKMFQEIKKKIISYIKLMKKDKHFFLEFSLCDFSDLGNLSEQKRKSYFNTKNYDLKIFI